MANRRRPIQFASYGMIEVAVRRRACSFLLARFAIRRIWLGQNRLWEKQFDSTLHAQGNGAGLERRE